MTQTRKLRVKTGMILCIVVAIMAERAWGVRIHGIPGTILGRTLLQSGPGWGGAAITTLVPGEAVQVLCKIEDMNAMVGDDPWWLRVHVWDSGREGWVSDYFVLCRHSSGNCRVPFCF